MTAGNTAKNPRVDWIDYAKGICIVMVVTLYATNYVHENAHAVGWMQHVADFAQPFRMPDFYLLAGLFVARVVERPLRAYIDSKVLYFMYFYALWATIKFANLHAGDLLSANRLDLLLEYLRLYIEPPTGPLWFIYILALFFIAVRLVRRLPILVVLPIAMVLEMAVTVGDMQLGVKLADKFARYFVFFYSGYVFSRYVFLGAAWAQAHMRLTLAIVLLWFMLNGLLVALHVTFLPGMQLVMGYVGACAVMLTSILIARMPHMAWLAYLGQHSIVVYLGFVVPIGLMRRFIVSPTLITDIGALALTVMVLSVAGSIVLYWAVRNTPLRFLFERPAWTSIAVRRAAAVPKEIATQ